MSSLDPFDLLRGSWRVHRRIEDFRSGRTGVFDGMATYQPAQDVASDDDGGVLSLHESGQMTMGDFVGPSQRRLEVVRLDDGRLRYRFLDGRPFIDVDLRMTSQRRTHACGDDLYDIAVHVRSPDALEEEWRVRGPAKDYYAATTLTRCDPSTITPSG